MSRPEFTISLVGRPNVGKSTLFNRIAGKRRAITFGLPGVTRDLVSMPVEYDGKRFNLIDTGGYMPGKEEGDLLSKVRGQVLRAIYESDVVIFLVDSRDGVLPLDKEILRMLREREKKFFLAANKVDARAGREGLDEFHELAAGAIYPVSAEHGTGVDKLLEDIVALIPAQDEAPAKEEVVARIAVVGRPNVGKSTLINTLAGYERVIASEVPGTTRDAIDVLIKYGGERFLFIDTAGIRAKRKTENVLEKFSVLKSLDSLRRCDLAILMIDGPEGLTHQDQQILRYILNEERAVVVVANKADLWKGEEERRKGLRAIQEGLGYATFAAIIPVVSTTGKGIPLLFKKIGEAFGSFRQRIPTAVLNKMAHAFVYSVPIPSKQGRNRALYMTQIGVMPPSFAVFVKERVDVPESFTRYLLNKIRSHFGFNGSPIRVVYREK
ncbi:MAG TPA: ribosome biogenesis GTPase Der [Candidatus Deferrimicrobiaceae bacterium]|jgi:GTP-binding protein